MPAASSSTHKRKQMRSRYRMLITSARSCTFSQARPSLSLTSGKPLAKKRASKRRSLDLSHAQKRLPRKKLLSPSYQIRKSKLFLKRTSSTKCMLETGRNQMATSWRKSSVILSRRQFAKLMESSSARICMKSRSLLSSCSSHRLKQRSGNSRSTDGR